MRTLRRAACLAALASTAFTAQAGAAPIVGAVTVGQVAATPGGACATGFDHVQVSVGTGTSYVMPATGNLTSWSMRTGPGLGQEYEMKVYRVISGLTYSVVGHSGPFPVAAGTVNTFFTTAMPVKAGDVLGIHTAGAGNSDCLQTGGTGDLQASLMGDLADGGSGLFISGGGPVRLNISATLDPTNTFTVGAVTNNRGKGTASVNLSVSNPGQVFVGGTGVAPSTLQVVEGDVQVAISTIAEKRKKLKKKGKVSVVPNLTFTPTGGSAATKTVTLQLTKTKKKKKKKKKR